MAFMRDYCNHFMGFGTDVVQIVSANWPGGGFIPGSWLISKPRSGILRISPGPDRVTLVAPGSRPGTGWVVVIKYDFYPDAFQSEQAEGYTKTLKFSHADPNKPGFKFVYETNLDTITGVITGTVYDPNADARLPFEATYFGAPEARLPLVTSFITEYARALPFSLTAPVISVPAEPQPLLQPAPALAPIVTAVEPTLAPYQPLATAVQPIAQVIYSEATQPPGPYIETLRPPGSIYTEEEWLEIMRRKKPPEDLLPKPDQPTVTDTFIQGEIVPLQAGLLGGLSSNWVLLLIGGAALFLLSEVKTKKPRGGGKRKGGY